MTTKYKQYIYKNGEWMLLGSGSGAVISNSYLLKATTENGVAHATTTSGNTFMNLVENGAIKDKINLYPAGGLSITSDTTGKISFTNTGVRSISKSSNGVLSINTNGTTASTTVYELPTAAADTLGGIKVGSNLTISNGVLSGKAGTVTSITLSTTNGSGIAIKDGNGTNVSGTAITSSGTRVIENTGVRSVSEGSNNGEISVNTGGTTTQVKVHGLGSRAFDSTEYIPTSDKGATNGVAPLTNGKILATYLPSYVDDVVEYAALGSFPETGEAGIIYVAKDTNYIYRWSGTGYVNVSADTNTTYTFATGDDNGTFKVTPSSGTGYPVAIKGLAGAAYKAVDTSIAASSTSANLPTSAAVASFVEGKGYVTSSGITAVTAAEGVGIGATTSGGSVALTNTGVRSVATGSTNGTISVNTNGTTAPVSVYGLKSAAYTESSAYATSGHTHDTTIADGGSGDTNQKTLAFGTKYKLTTGGTNFIFTMPSNPNTNTTYSLTGALSSHKFTQSLTAGGSGGTNTSTDITFVAGSNITLTDDTSNRKITIAATDTTYESKAAASSGTDVSLVTTGEKYAWNAVTNKADKATTVTDVAYDSTEHRITKTINGLTSDVVTIATLKTELGLGSAAYTASTAYAPASHNQAWSTITGAADLNAIESLADNGKGFLKKTAANTWTLDTNNYSVVSISNLLADGTDIGTLTINGTAVTLKAPTPAGLYVLPTAADNTLGGIRTGFTTSGNNRAVQVDENGNAYVTQKDTDTNALYSISSSLSSHKITTSLTASGSGGTSTSTDFTLAQGSNITLTDGDNRTITIAASDAKVTQTATNTNANYEVLFSGTADNTTRTEGARKYSNLTFNPSSGTLTATTFSGSLAWSNITSKPNNGLYVYSVEEGTDNGSLSVNAGGTTSQIPVHGLKSAAYTESSAYAAASHNQALSTITGADDLQAIEALTGTKGFLKKTGANAWELDTTVVSAVAWDSTNNKITKTINGTTSDVVTAAQLKTGLGLGSAAYTASSDYATSGHTHSTSIATSSGTNQLTLAFGTKYALTAGGTSYIFTMPSNPNTNTTYTISTGDTNGYIKVTPSSGTAYSVLVKDGPFLPLAGGTVTGETTFNNNVTINDELAADSATLGNLIVTGAGNFTNGIIGNLTGNVTGTASGNLTNVAWDSTNKRLTKTINGTTSEIVTIATMLTAAGISSPMQFIGSVGTSGTVTWANLAIAAAANKGYAYKVITDHTAETGKPAAKVGDVIVSNGSEWIVIPSGDEPSGTVTNVATGVGLTGGPITSSGTIKANLSSESSVGTIGSNKVYAVGVDSNGKLAVSVPWNDTDTKVTQTAVTASGYTNWRSLIWGSSNSGTEGFAPSTVTDGVFTTDTLSVQPSTGTIRATTFKGALSGTASGNVTSVQYDSTNAKLTYTKNGSNTDIVTVTTLKSALGSMTPASHTHGNITNGGDITATAPTIENGDQIIINDNTASKITNGPTFDGSTTTTALTPKGTWETFSKFSGSYNDLTNKPTIPTVPSNIVNTITTTAGAHSAITSQKGDVSFNVPTTAAHVGIKFGYTTSGNNRAVLQDSSGNLYVTQKDDNSNTTYTLTNALASHKFTWTLTAGGSGSGSTTTSAELVAGTGITLTDDTTNKKITIASSVTNTDTKVKLTSTTTNADYYLALGPSSITSGTAYEEYYNTALKFNPSTGKLTTSKLNAGETVLGNTEISGEFEADSATVGNLIVNGSTRFVGSVYGLPTIDLEMMYDNGSISADDITAWTTNTPTVVTKKTVVTSASGATASYSAGVITFTDGSFSTGDSVSVTPGTAASLSYTARSITNWTSAGPTPVIASAESGGGGPM